MTIAVRLHTKGDQPIRLASLYCSVCGIQGVAIVAMQRVEAFEHVSGWCSPECATTDGWPWLKSEYPRDTRHG